MQATLKAPTYLRHTEKVSEKDGAGLEALIAAMGKRLQAEYLEGAIPYLRSHEPELWAHLERLDQEETLDALVEYEQLFFEGLRRYVAFLREGRKAA